MYSYSVWQWLLVFYIYCVLGWCFETAVVSVQQRRYVNRGFLRGPMLPIYGFGAAMLLHIALPLESRPVLLFLSSMVAATVFELVVGWTMEKLFRVKYWDYSGHRFQFAGLVCLQSSVCWGVMGLLLAHVIHPPVQALVFAIPLPLAVILAVLLCAAFLSDVAVSVRAALNLAQVLAELDLLREEAERLRARLSETALARLESLGEAIEPTVRDAREQLTERLGALQARFEQRADALRRTGKSLLRGNPTARAQRYNDTLQRLKKYLGSGKRG